MRKRSSKILAASLSLLIGLNGMPLTALAVENEATAPAVSEAAQENETAEPTPEEKEPASKTEEQQSSDEENVSEVAGENKEESLTGESEGATEEKTEEAGAEEEKTAEETTVQEQPAAEEEPSAEAPAGPAEEKTEMAAPEEEEAEQPVQQEPAAYAPANNTVLLDAQDANTDVLHVSADGSDGAYTSLRAAVDAANDLAAQQVTIELDSDITATGCARIKDKDITLDGNGHTISRGDYFQTIQDNNRSTYNPAMIEVTVPRQIGASLTLLDVILDDAGKAEGTVFAQAPGGGAPSIGYVQDGIVAAYGTDKATAKVILGDGAVLQNFGGMSAVRVTGGATLTMQSGSKIQDTTVTDRIKDATDSNGPAGAVWVQGTSATMEEGAEITNMVGRAFYVDGGSVTVGGKITGTKADAHMWQGTAGIGLHVRGGAQATLTSTTYIGDIDTNASNGSVLGIYGSDLDMQQGAVLKNVKGISALYMDDMGNDYSHVALVNGTVDGVENNPVMRSWYGHIDLGPTSVVQNCVASADLSDGQMLYTNNGSRYTLEGKILNNKGTALYIANQSGGRPEVVMKEGAVISGTQGAGLLGSGVAVRVNNGSLFTMEGGEISGNGIGVQVSGKTNFKGVTFLMNGGKIIDNGIGVSYTVAGESVVRLNGGEISNNKSTYQDVQISAIGGSATDGYENFYLAQGMLQDAPIVEVSFGTLHLDAEYPTISLGQASAAAQNEIKNQVTSAEGQEKWQTKGSSLWFKTETASTLHFTMARPYAVDKGIGLYAGYLPLKADGNPADGAELTLVPLVNSDTLDITLTGLTPGTSYAMMLVVTDKYYITVNLADITVYMGGEDGTDNVVNGDNQIVSSNSLPAPGFLFELPKGVTDISKVTFEEVDGTKTWTAVPYDGVAGHNVYKLQAGQGQTPVRMQFTDEESGKVVVEDSFTVGEQLNKSFTMDIYKDTVGAVEAVVDGDTSGTTYGIILNSGTLTVRGTTSGVQFGHVKDEIQTGKPGVKADSDVTFTINGSDVEANQKAIALLFDNIIENTASESGRSSLLAKRADEILKDAAVPAGMVRNYQFKYLDLVDTSNGNAWVEAKDASGNPAEVTVCWPYPKGTDKNTEFTLLHFEDLHRDMSANEVAGDIANCTVTPMTITKTDTHIEFTTTEFSPFALAWNSPKPTTPVVDDEEESSDNNSTTAAPAATPAPTAQPAAPVAQTAAVIPQTGDNSQPLLWVALLVISGSLGAALALKRRKE